jgi:hypothetical protein
MWKRFAFSGLIAGIAGAALADNTYSPQGGEYPIAGSLAGDQVFPHLALGSSGGYLVWQDNVTDGDGFGISARRINSSLSGSFGVFRVNEKAAGDQENVRVAMLKDGGAVFVWQSGTRGFQHINARFLKGDGTFATGDRVVNTYTNNHQMDPALSVLSGGNVVVTWSSYGQDLSVYGVYAQLFTPIGDKVGSEFQVNQSTSLSQRSPSAASLPDGGFALVWVGERTTSAPISQSGLIVVTNPVARYTADIFGRMFNADGSPRGGEFRVSSGNDPCANPAVSAAPDGGIAVAWSQKGSMVNTNSWDVFARGFDSSFHPVNEAAQVNSYSYGEQFAPRIASIGSDYMVVWTSLAQDGSREGVYGRFLSSAGNPVGDEILVNTTTVSQQMHPSVSSDGTSRFLVVWTSFIGGNTSFDLFAQRYAASQSLPVPAAPSVSAPFVVDNSGVYQPQLLVSWPDVEGFPVANYELYVDGAASPAVTTTANIWTLSGLAPSSTHSLRMDYVTTDGRHSPLSAQATGTTWSGASYGGIPFEWMTANFGTDVLAWPKPGDDSDGDGASNMHEFLAGTAPQDPNSVMRVQLVSTAQGTQLSWNGQPGSVYQVQISDNLSAGSWTNFGAPRFAVGTSDAIPAGGVGAAAYYRVVRLR